jgi:hypothetical protein
VTNKTRRLLFLSVLVALLTVPVETILLRAVQSTDDTTAIQTWADSLDQTDLQTAASQIQIYPFQYRRAIMLDLTSKGRSAVWRRHLQTYLQTHTALDPAAVDAINAASALASPDYFEGPTADARAQLHAVASQIESLLGRDQAEYLLYYLGPKDGTFASFEPVSMRIERTIRGLFTMKAQSGTCDCSLAWGCPDWRASCLNTISCQQPTGWQCGWLWSDPCDGDCGY